MKNIISGTTPQKYSYLKFDKGAELSENTS